jgi:hypothetical protein
VEILVTADSIAVPDQQSKKNVPPWLAPLTGLGQIMFQDSAWTGAFFLTGIAIVSPVTAAGAALGALVGTLAAMLLKYDEQEIRDGIYGFNASLVGIAMIARYQPHVLTFLLIIVGAGVSTMLTREMRRRVSHIYHTVHCDHVGRALHGAGVQHSTGRPPDRTGRDFGYRCRCGARCQ